MQSVKISVVIPVYNVEKYLQECVNSVLRQTYTDFEVILVDDGSTDSGGRICDDYAQKDPRVRVIHQANGGLSVARNTGLRAAQGKYVYFLDSDDYIEDHTLEALIFLAEKESADIVFFDGYVFFDECPYCLFKHSQGKILHLFQVCGCKEGFPFAHFHSCF